MEVSVLVVNLVIAVILFIYIFYKKTFEYWKSRGVPYVEPQFPYGNSKGVGTKFHTYAFVKRVYNELKSQGSVGGVYISFRPTAIITDLDLIKTILVKDFNYFPNRGSYYNSKDDPISEHISNIENEQWKNVRSKLTPTFTSGKLKMMFDTIQNISEKFMATIERESATDGSLEIKEIMARFTCDVIGNIAFGLECDSLNDRKSKFFEMAIRSMDSFHFVLRLVLMRYKKFARALHIKLTPVDVSKFYMDVVKSIMDTRNQNKDHHRADLMNILMNLMKNEGMSFNQAAAQSFFYFVSGYETTSTTLTFCIYELSQNQEIQEKAREDVCQALEKHQNQLTYESISELNFIDKIVKETLRKWPPSVTLQRVAADNYKVPNSKVVIEKGCAIMVPVYGIHHDESIYPEPEKFDPSRFDSEEVEKRHPFSYLPFGEGPRNCPAIRFSYLETKICLARLLTNYQFSLDTNRTENPLTISPSNFMMSPAKGVFVNFKKI